MHPEKLALPLGMNFSTQQDQQLSQDVVNEMVRISLLKKELLILTEKLINEKQHVLSSIRHKNYSEARRTSASKPLEI